MMNDGNGNGDFEGRRRPGKEVEYDSDRDKYESQDQVCNKRKKKYRHNPHQIQQLEAFFKYCPHPHLQQRLELGNRLALDNNQVKFWFQNRRSQIKAQLEHHENSTLRQENDNLNAENKLLWDSMRKPLCNDCKNPSLCGEFSLQEQHLLRIENTLLKEELKRVCYRIGKFVARSSPPTDGALSSPPT